MTPLLAKDLRLSIDALRPWLVVVASVLGLWALAAWLHGSVAMRSMLPMKSMLSSSRILGELAAALTLSTGLVAAWITAVVVHGDQTHQARGLSATLPVSRSRQAATKFASILAACSVPVGCAVAAQVLRGQVNDGTVLLTPDIGQAWYLPLLMALVGIGFAMGVARACHGVFETVGLAFLAAIGAATVAYFAAWGSYGFSEARAISLLGPSLMMDEFKARVIAQGPIAGLLFAATALLVMEFIALHRGRRSRSVAPMLLVLLTMSALGGILGLGMAYRSDREIQRQVRAAEVMALVMTADPRELVAFIEAWNRGGQPTLGTGETQASMLEVAGYLGGRTEPEVRAAIWALDRMDAPREAVIVMSLGLENPSGALTAYMLDALAAFPRDSSVLSMASGRLGWEIAVARSPEYPDWRLANPAYFRTGLSGDRALAAFAVTTLQARLREIGTEPTQSRRAIDAMRDAWQLDDATLNEALPEERNP